MSKGNKTKKKKNGKKVLSNIRIDEISPVDFPCQEPALADIMKRGKNDHIAKNVLLTTVVDDHQHSLSMKDYDGKEITGGQTSYNSGDTQEEMHSHPWIIDTFGRVAIGMALGHRHEVLKVSKRPILTGERPMKFKKSLLASAASVAGQIMKFGTDAAKDWGDEEYSAIRKAAVEHDIQGLLPDDGPLALQKSDTKKSEKEMSDEDKKKAEELEARLNKAEQISEMTGVQKSHYDTLDADGKTAFLKMDSGKRTKAIAKAQETDPVIATINGVDIRKSADPMLVAMAQELKKAKEDRKIEKAAAKAARIEKKAAEISKNLSGDDETIEAIVGAIEDIADKDIRKAAYETLQASGERRESDYEEAGAISKSDAADAETKLTAIAKSIQKENPELTEEAAMTKAMLTKKGRKHYATMRGYEAGE